MLIVVLQHRIRNVTPVSRNSLCIPPPTPYIAFLPFGHSLVSSADDRQPVPRTERVFSLERACGYLNFSLGGGEEYSLVPSRMGG